ncbi:hypothetical protein [Nocardiopsis synnemataformans]|uniref:hypothetical protein n=1 Tax=Nocardiopsis synnemataformans TaxID=61305 RepID=UPI003EB88858
MLLPACNETTLDSNGRRRVCSEDAGHLGDHVDVKCYRWEPPLLVHARLHERWQDTHHIALLPSGIWLATAHDPEAPWRSEVEFTAAQLEKMLRLHNPHLVPRGVTV